MIDLHCHILPGMDDGPATLDEALAMCRIAADDGIRTLVATPHFSPDTNAWGARDLFERLERLEAALHAKKVEITVLPGAEVALYPEITQSLASGAALTMNHAGRYLLLEFPFDAAPPNWDLFLRNILQSGVVPIIAHPERNGWFFRHPQAAEKIVRMGCLMQVTAMSILGGFGEEVREFGLFLLKRNFAQIMATDAHSAAARPPKLAEAVRASAKVIGEERARALVSSFPEAVIKGKPVRVVETFDHGEKKELWLKRIFRAMARNG